MNNSRLNSIMNFLEIDEVAIVTSGVNRYYLTGFNSSEGTVLITKSKAYFIVDFRYFEKAKREVKGFEVVLTSKLFCQISEFLKLHLVKKIVLETNFVSVDRFKQIKDYFNDFSVEESSKLSNFFLTARSVKSKDEIESIKQAQKITDETFSYILNNIRSGISEIDLMLEMEFYIRKLGSEGVSFNFIVVSGKNSSSPHGVPTNKLIEDGDFITMDFGAVVNGYHSDMTRTVALKEVTQKQRKVYDLVLLAQESALKSIKAGVVCKEVDAVARNIINNEFSGCFGHGLGHGVGLEIHENPNFNMSCETVLESGMVLTVEPGIYIENEFGVRIEDMVIINENSFENITKSSKNLIIV